MKRLFCAIIIASLLLFSACGQKSKNDQSESGTLNESSVSEISLAEESKPIGGDVETVPEYASSFESPADQAESESSSDYMTESSSTEPVQPLTLTLVVPEGYTLPRIGMVLEEKGVCTADEFISAAQNGDFNEFSLMSEQTFNPDRCFKLEGYLFPDTYNIYSSDTPDAIIRKMLGHIEQKIGADLRNEISASGYTADQILIMASIIEKEAFGAEHMPMISSVLHNRLDSGMRLQCDVTITYVEGAIKPFITGDKDRYNSFYNTYKCPALPAGAICNPGISAIKAALRPAETDFLYFVTDSEKNYYYAATWEEHEINVANALGE